MDTEKSSGCMILAARGLVLGVGVLSLLGGVAYFVDGTMKANAAQHWPSVPGKIVANDVDVQVSRDSGSKNRPSSETVSYVPLVTYVYKLDGRVYRNDVIDSVDTTSFDSAGDAQTFLESYRVGQTVDVLHDPDDPHISALSVSRPSLWAAIFLVVFGLIWLLADRLVLRHFLSDMRRQGSMARRGQQAASRSSDG